jgi:hypothetical protein
MSAASMAVLANEEIMNILHLQKTQTSLKNRPRQPLGPYLYYFIYARSKIASVHPNKKASELISLLGDQWVQMSTEEKAPFLEINDKDVKRYSRQLAEFKKNGEFHDEEGNIVTKHKIKPHKKPRKLHIPTCDAKREHPEIKAKKRRQRQQKKLEIRKKQLNTQAKIQELPEIIDKGVIPRPEQLEGSCVVRPIQKDDVEVPKSLATEGIISRCFSELARVLRSLF